MKENEVKYKGVVITEEDRQFHTTIGEDKFTIQIPNNEEKSLLATAVSVSIGGANIQSIDPIDYQFIRMIVILCRVVKEGPKWWEGADKCPDEKLLSELWRFYLESSESFSTRLKTKAGK